MNLAEYRYALECSINDFSWPPGMLPDIDLMAPNDPELENAGFQRGLEHVSLGSVNTCAWYMTWLDARQEGDMATEAEALEVITEVIPYFPDVIPNFPADGYDPTTTRFHLDAAAQAELGDPSLIQAWVDNNCQYMPPSWQSGS